MLKKFAALFAVLFLVAACSGAEEGDIITGTSGAGSTGAGAGSGADAAGGGAGGLRDSDLTSSDLAAGAPSPGTVEDFEVNVGDPGAVARSEGKAKRVTDNRVKG